MLWEEGKINASEYKREMGLGQFFIYDESREYLISKS